MSKDDFIEDGEQDLTEGLDSNGSVEETEEEEVVKKKSSLPMMAAVGVGVAAVVGFAGFKIYSQMFAAPPAPMMDAGPIVAPVVQPAPPQVQAPLPAPVVPAPVAVDQQQAPAPAVGAQAPSLQLPTPETPLSSPAVLAGAGVDMTAVMELKAATEEQAKKVSAIEEKIVTLEQRIAALEAGKHVAPVKPEKAVKLEKPSDGEKSIKPAERKKLKKVSKKSLASKKRGSEWKKSVDKPSSAITRSRTQLLEKLKAAEAAVASSAKSAEAVLPPAPDFGAKAEPAKTEAKVQPIAKQESSAVVSAPKVAEPALPALPVAKPVSVSGLKVQAVIPGRAWLSDGNGPTRSYAVGDVVRAGVVIRSIDADSAVVTTSAGTLK